MKHLAILISLSVLLFVGCSQSPESTTPTSVLVLPTKEDIHKKVEAFVKEHPLMGQIEIRRDGNSLYTFNTGYQDVLQQQKITGTTQLRMGSIGKTFTATLIFKAIEAGKLSLETPLAEFLPEFPEAKNITIEHLIHHSSGIPNFTRDPNFFKYHTGPKTSEELLDIVSKLERPFEVGTHADYSNSNYTILAVILEKVYGKSYDELIDAWIVKPLGLQHTFSETDTRFSTSKSFDKAPEQDAWQSLPVTHPSLLKGAGSIVSTAEELGMFLEALFQGRLINASHLEQMKTIERTFGRGLFRYEVANAVGYGHRGRIDGFRATAVYFPESQFSVVIATNASTGDINDLFTTLVKTQLPESERSINKEDAASYAGQYIQNGPDGIDRFSFVAGENGLELEITKDEIRPLVYYGDHTFVFEQIYAAPMTFIFNKEARKMTLKQGDYEGDYLKE